jgi:hypothetical protein
MISFLLCSISFLHFCNSCLFLRSSIQSWVNCSRGIFIFLANERKSYDNLVKISNFLGWNITRIFLFFSSFCAILILRFLAIFWCLTEIDEKFNKPQFFEKCFGIINCFFSCHASSFLVLEFNYALLESCEFTSVDMIVLNIFCDLD